MLCESGDVQVTMTTDQGVNVPVKLIDSHDRTYRVEFEPTIVGTYNTNVMFAGQLTPASPYKINVQPAAVDTSKVRVTDLPDSKSTCLITLAVYSQHQTRLVSSCYRLHCNWLRTVVRNRLTAWSN